MTTNSEITIFSKGFELDTKYLPLTLIGFGINHLQERIERPHGIPTYQWIQCTHGKGVLIIDGQKAILQEGTAIFLMQNVPHSYYEITSDWRTHYVCFSGTSCVEILKSIGLTQSGVYSFSNPDILTTHLNTLFEIQQKDSDLIQQQYSKELYSLLLDLSLDITRIYSTIPAMENESIHIVIHYIEENYSSSITLNELADLVHLTKEYLCTLFKKLMNQTIIAFLQSIRIVHAKVFLIRYPEKKVMEICTMCGFENTSYFCHVFRKIEGLSPEEFRKRH